MAKGVYILDSEVVIVGGGPFGLMLAIELGRRNVTTLLYDAKNGTAFNPQANATQARTMEYFRRLGIADEIRALGMPADYPTDIAYFTRYGHHELGRFEYPHPARQMPLCGQIRAHGQHRKLRIELVRNLLSQYYAVLQKPTTQSQSILAGE